MRLTGYDYAEPGKYFVTTCTWNRRILFGRIVDGRMILSEEGAIVDGCWKEIPVHFENCVLGAFQAMPDHLHGILEIKESPVNCPPVAAPSSNPVVARYIVPQRRLSLVPQPGPLRIFGRSEPGTLSTIIGNFKAAASREIRRKRAHHRAGPIWQRNFHDHIIRGDREHFLIERYIQVNPLFWEIERNAREILRMDEEGMRITLRDRYGLAGDTLNYVLRRCLDQGS